MNELFLLPTWPYYLLQSQSHKSKGQFLRHGSTHDVNKKIKSNQKKTHPYCSK